MSKLNKSGLIRFTVKSNENDGVTNQNNLNSFHSSFQSDDQLFTPSTSIVTERFRYDYPFLFYYYFRAAFFLCFFPFWVQFNDKQTKLKLVTYKLQRILCALVHITAFLLALFYFRWQIAEPLKKRPDKVFGMANSFCWALYILIYARVVWSTQIINLLQQPLPRLTYKVRKS